MSELEGRKSNRGRKRIASGLSVDQTVTLDNDTWRKFQAKARLHVGKAQAASELCRQIALRARLMPDGSMYVPPFKPVSAVRSVRATQGSGAGAES